MDIAINIALLLIGAGATLTAFGGETWLKGPEPLLTRITVRGWISLACLAITLTLALYKEIRAQDAADEARIESATAKAALAAANANISALSNELQSTTHQLSQQTQVNLITALANGNIVHEGAWWLTFGHTAASANDIAELLCSSIPPKYFPALLVRLHFHPTLGINASVNYRYEAGRLELVPLDSWMKDEVRIVPPRFLDNDSPFPRDAASERLKKEHHLILVAKPHADANSNAAIALRDMSEGHEVGTLTLRLERTFSSEDEWKAFVEGHSELKVGKAWHNLSKDTYKVEFILPQELRKTTASYWRRGITKSDYHIYLKSEAHLMISAPAKLSAITDTESSITAHFVPAGKPELKVGIEEI